MPSAGGNRSPAFSAAALFTANHSMILRELDDTQDREAPDEVVEIRTLLDETISFEGAVHRLRQRVQAKYRTCQKLMMGCWKLEEKVAATSTVSSNPCVVSLYYHYYCIAVSASLQIASSTTAR